MQYEKLLDSTFECLCGKTHHVPLRTIIYAEDAIEAVPDVLQTFTGGRRAAVLADERTCAIAGEKACRLLRQGGWTVELVIPGDQVRGGPVCDDITLDGLERKVGEFDVALAVGSGVINDLTKWLAFERATPYAAIATAATMNGYAAANVAATIRGVKTLCLARAPLAIFAVPSIICGAPFELTAAGLGDVIAKPVSTADWLMNHILLDEYFCKFCSTMINDLEPEYFSNPAAIRNRQPAAIETLFNALVYSGVAMTVVGTSAPASGGEHMLSHTLDMMSSVDGAAHDLHGRQVGLGTVFACALYGRILKIDTPEPVLLPGEIDAVFWGDLAGSVAQQYRNKEPLMRTIAEKIRLPGIWDAFRDAVRPHVRTPDAVKECLREAGAAHTVAQIGCEHGRFADAVYHMHEIRTRPTVVDLARLLGVLPGAAEALIEQYLTD